MLFIKAKSSRGIQRLSLLCWVKVQKGKKTSFVSPNSLVCDFVGRMTVNLQKLHLQ